MKTLKVEDWREIPNNFTGIIEYSNGTRYWLKAGELHREDGPACEYSHGEKYWHLEGAPYEQINLKDFVILDYFQGEYDLMWYRLLGKDKVFEHPDMPGLIVK